jgi:hypothetical protein
MADTLYVELARVNGKHRPCGIEARVRLNHGEKCCTSFVRSLLTAVGEWDKTPGQFLAARSDYGVCLKHGTRVNVHEELIHFSQPAR